MYEELQRNREPKPPKPIKSIRADGIAGLLGIVSPSKYWRLMGNLFPTDEEQRYIEADARYREEMVKWRIYKRQATREEWQQTYRRYRKQLHPERLEAWKKKQDAAAAQAIKAVRMLLGEE